MPCYRFVTSCTSRPIYDISADDVQEAVQTFRDDRSEPFEEEIEEHHVEKVCLVDYLAYGGPELPLSETEAAFAIEALGLAPQTPPPSPQSLPRVIVLVRGGVVQAVRADCPLELSVLDYDDMEVTPEDARQEFIALEEEYKKLAWEVF